jgi:hypothetical protein
MEEIIWEPRCRLEWKSDIEMDLEEMRCEVVD